MAEARRMMDIRWIALLLLIGVTACLWWPVPAIDGKTLQVTVGGLGAAGMLLIIRVSGLRSLGWLLLGIALAGWRVAGLMQHSLPPRLEARPLAVTACLSGEADSRGGTGAGMVTRMDARLVSPPRLQGLGVRLSIYGEAVSLRAGECWRMTVKLKRAHGYANPGGFDYARWLFARGLMATAWVTRPKQMERVSESGGSGLQTASALQSLRQQWLHRLREVTQDMAFSGVLLAVTMGERERITEQQWQVFRNTGTAHLVAISGLHITLISGLVFGLVSVMVKVVNRALALVIIPYSSGFQPLLHPISARRIATLVSLIAAFFYAFLADFSVPVVRATVLVSVVGLGLLLRRPVQASRSLAWALLVVLVIDPLAVLSPGFWLSFSAVAAILWLLPVDRRVRCSGRAERASSPVSASSGRVRVIAGLLHDWGRLQTGIALGLVPLTLLWFQQASLIAPLANLFAIPLFTLSIIPLALVAAIAVLIVPAAGLWLLQLCDDLLGWIWHLLEAFSQPEWASWTPPQLPPLVWLLLVAGAIVLMAPRGFPGRWLGLLMCLPAVSYQPPRSAPGEVQLTLLDVGQGLSAVIETHGKTLLFDAGPAYRSGFNTGDSVVLPFLRSRGVRRLDRMVISHTDSDHVGGAAALLAAMPVARIDSSEPLAFRDKTGRGGARHCQAGQGWAWDGVSFAYLWPGKDPEVRQNNRSCVLRIESNGQVLLLTGDIEADAEQGLLQHYPAGANDVLRANLLVAPHHGSNTSSTEAFISRVQPEWVLFPLGYRNRYHFPSAQVVARFHKAGVKMLDTASAGAITVTTSGRSALDEPLAWRQQHPRWWR